MSETGDIFRSDPLLTYPDGWTVVRVGGSSRARVAHFEFYCPSCPSPRLQGFATISEAARNISYPRTGVTVGSADHTGKTPRVSGVVPRTAGIWLDLRSAGLLDEGFGLPFWILDWISRSRDPLVRDLYARGPEHYEAAVSALATRGSWDSSLDPYFLLGELPPVLDPRVRGPW